MASYVLEYDPSSWFVKWKKKHILPYNKLHWSHEPQPSVRPFLNTLGIVGKSSRTIQAEQLSNAIGLNPKSPFTKHLVHFVECLNIYFWFLCGVIIYELNRLKPKWHLTINAFYCTIYKPLVYALLVHFYSELEKIWDSAILLWGEL